MKKINLLDFYSDVVGCSLTMLCCGLVLRMIFYSLFSPSYLIMAIIFFTSMCAFYYLRGFYAWYWSLGQAIVNSVLSAGMILGVAALFNEIGTAYQAVEFVGKRILNMIFVGTFFLSVIPMNKIFLDFLIDKLNAKKRDGKPVKLH